MKHSLKIFCLLITSLVLGEGSTWARPLDPTSETTNPLDLVESEIAPASDLANAINQDGGNPEVLQRAAEKAYSLEASVLTDISYRSNLDYDGNSGRDGMLWKSFARVQFDYTINEQWTFTSDHNFESALYSGVDGQDYWGLRSHLKLEYQAGDHWPTLYAGPELYRYESFDDGDELTRAVAPAIGANYHFHIPSTSTSFYTDLNYQYHYAAPSFAERHDLTAAFAVSQKLTRGWFAQVYYQYRYSDYVENVGREDSRHFVGGSLIWRPVDSLIIRLNTSFEDNDSNRSFAEYQNFSVGGGSSLTYRF